MKRILTLLMTVSLLLCLAACGQPADHAPEQSPQQAEPSEPPAQTEPPALEGEALSVLPAEDAGLAEGGYDAYREADPMAEIVLLPTHSVETIPNRGVSYVDADGALRQYAIVESGKDGTIFLMEEVFDSAA